MLKSKSVLFLSTAAVSVLCLAGCGGNDSNNCSQSVVDQHNDIAMSGRALAAVTPTTPVSEACQKLNTHAVKLQTFLQQHGANYTCQAQDVSTRSKTTLNSADYKAQLDRVQQLQASLKCP